MSNLTPPGWYPDEQGTQRWWDGSAWAAPGVGPAQEPAGTQVLPVQSYGAPAGFGGPVPGKSKTGLIIALGGGLVAVVAIIIVLILVIGGGGGASSDDPAETVQNFIDAASDGDCDAAAELLTGDFRKTFPTEDCDQASSGNPDEEFEDVSFDVGKADVDGDEATVPVTLSSDSEEVDNVTFSYELTKADGKWLISGFVIPGLDDLPTDLPTDFPTDIPTDFPTDFLTDFPTDFPTDFLTDFPTDFPTDFLTDFPTDFPTG